MLSIHRSRRKIDGPFFRPEGGPEGGMGKKETISNQACQDKFSIFPPKECKKAVFDPKFPGWLKLDEV